VVETSGHVLTRSRDCAAPNCTHAAAPGEDYCERCRRPKQQGQIHKTPTALKLPDGLTWDRWRQLFATLAEAERSIAWWIGDALVYAEDRFGDHAAELVQLLDRADATLRIYAWVSRRVPPHIRRAELSHTHHKIVAGLDHEEQERFLERAVREGLPSGPLLQAVRELHVTDGRGRRASTQLVLRGVGELRALCARAAEHRGVPLDVWAAEALERAAHAELVEMA
jgi:hypothetical protein